MHNGLWAECSNTAGSYYTVMIDACSGQLQSNDDGTTNTEYYLIIWD